jgi:pyruvate dehydrogenase kinase 2/3/4
MKILLLVSISNFTIEISDEGGGIPRSDLPLVWTYMYTTADNPMKQDSYSGTNVVPMAGYGYGLPISRLYASYFGGNLNLISMEGFGTDAYLHLRRLSDSDEPLT